ncbi:MAG TPA: hypothetical protein VFW22_13775 [Pseudolabrys sp.]|nr:hypothetical protein [Pseudolabrys sp.]
MRFALELDFTKVWVRITGQWSVDNYGEIRFDGHPLPAGSGGGETSLASMATGGGYVNYGDQHDFWVHNEGTAGANNPCGLNVYRMSLEINPVHEFPSVTGVAQRLGP